MSAGRVLFSETATYSELDRRFAEGEIIKSTKLTEEFDFQDFVTQYPSALSMFVVNGVGQLTILATDTRVTPVAGQTVIALVAPVNKERSDETPE